MCASRWTPHFPCMPCYPSVPPWFHPTLPASDPVFPTTQSLSSGAACESLSTTIFSEDCADFLSSRKMPAGGVHGQGKVRDPHLEAAPRRTAEGPQLRSLGCGGAPRAYLQRNVAGRRPAVMDGKGATSNLFIPAEVPPHSSSSTISDTESARPT